MADLGVRPGLTAAVSRVAAVDAQTFWMSAKVPNDQFLLYAFAGDPGELTAALDDVRRRAEACPDLRLRIADDCPARYPRWVPGAVDDAQFVEADQVAVGEIGGPAEFVLEAGDALRVEPMECFEGEA